MKMVSRRELLRKFQYALYVDRRRRLCAAIMILGLITYQRIPDRRVWVDHWVGRRETHGAHNNLFLELRFEKPDKYRKCLRLTPEMFDWLLQKVSPLIKKQDTKLRRRIPPSERLPITLRHLATGETQESLSLLYRVGQSTISGIIKETCKAIHFVLKDVYLQFPKTEEEWKNVATEYGDCLNFSNCIGAIDGKHVVIAPPLKSGSLFYNYKETFSIVLMAVVDANLRVIYADVGTNGRISDRGIWNKCSLKQGFDSNYLKIPSPSALPGTQDKFPCVFVGDEGFSLSKRLLLPYPKQLLKGRKDRRIFNYRLSRARRCSENAFGIMANRFQILRTPMRYDPDDAVDIVWAILALHNVLRSDSIGRTLYSPPTQIDQEDVLTGRIEPGECRREPAPQGFVPLDCQGGNRHTCDALALRENWCTYFNTAGAVPWQEQMILSPT